MRRLLIIVALLAVAIPFGLFIQWDTQTRSLGNKLIADLTTAQKQVFTRTPPPGTPLHDNGFQCLGAMLDVTPELRPFTPGAAASLDPFITGKQPIGELPPEVRFDSSDRLADLRRRNAALARDGGERRRSYDCEEGRELAYAEACRK